MQYKNTIRDLRNETSAIKLIRFPGLFDKHQFGDLYLGRFTSDVEMQEVSTPLQQKFFGK